MAAEIERLVADGIDPAETAVLVRSVRNEGQLMATALEERGIPYRLVGGAGFFERSEVRDLLAWLRLLANPQDSRAVVRALMRPPVELGPVDLARCTQIARRRKSDMITGLRAALESPDVPPEARARIETFLKLHRSACRAFDEMRPDLFVHRLIERIGLRKQHLFNTSSESLERLVNIAKFADLAAAWVRHRPGRTSRDFAEYVSAVSAAGLREDEAVVHGHPHAVQVMTMHGAKGLEFDCVYVLGVQQSRMPGRRRSGELVPDVLLKEDLPETSTEAHMAEMRRLLYVAMTRARKRLVLSWPRVGGAGRPERAEALLLLRGGPRGDRGGRGGARGGAARHPRGPLRRVPHAARRGDGRRRAGRGPDGRDAARRAPRRGRRDGALHGAAEAGVADRAPPAPGGAAGGDRRDQLADHADRQPRAAPGSTRTRTSTSCCSRPSARTCAGGGSWTSTPTSSLEAYLPIRGGGLMLSATDIDIYRTCPLRYKFARVFNIPKEQTLQQRFGILFHQVLERYHSQLVNQETIEGIESLREPTPDKLMMLFETGWRRLGFGESNEERQLHEKAVVALERYHERFAGEQGSPVWFERNFSFRIGPHMLRGRVDRVDRHPDGSYELIDYKTGQGAQRRRSSRTTSSSRCTRSARASRGSSTPRARATTTCSTTSRCRCSRPRRT